MQETAREQGRGAARSKLAQLKEEINLLWAEFEKSKIEGFIANRKEREASKAEYAADNKRREAEKAGYGRYQGHRPGNARSQD